MSITQVGRRALKAIKLLNGVSIPEGHNIFGVDWSMKNGIQLFDPRTKKCEHFPSLESAAAAHPKSVFCLEASGESFELQRRDVVLNAFATNDIIVYCFNTKYTDRYRRLWFANDPRVNEEGIKAAGKTGDQLDAEVICAVFTKSKLTVHPFRPLMFREGEGDVIREKIREALVRDRYLLEDEQALNCVKKYNPEKFLDGDLIFYTNGEVRTQIGRILLVAEFVREAKLGFRTFRRQLGNYGAGYKSMARSEFYHWLTRIVTNGRLKRHPSKSLANLTTGERAVHKQVMKEADKAAKLLWRLTESK